jgi:MFS transporter, FSR family, fosmidomycin resistance protein
MSAVRSRFVIEATLYTIMRPATNAGPCRKSKCAPQFGRIQQMTTPAATAGSAGQSIVQNTVFPVLIAISFSHFLNDTLQSLIPATYPILKSALRLSYTQVGLITLTYQLIASLLQPVVGTITDRKPLPYSLAVGMSFTLAGLALLSLSGSYPLVLLSVALVGMGSAVFHPESSRVAHMAAGRRRGLAQSVFQVGGNAGSSLGPLLAAVIITGRGHSQIAWFTPVAMIAILLLWRVGNWYASNTHRVHKQAAGDGSSALPLQKRTIVLSIGILLVLIFSKYFYLASMTSYFTFYLISRFHLTVAEAQVHLFVFLLAVAAGTVIGGPVGDRFGRKYVIWGSILGAAPFTLALPHAGLLWTTIFSVLIGVILSSAFSAILVYAQELVPGKVGMISGFFFGFAFGMGGIGSALLGVIADHTSIVYVYRLCAFLPLIGLIAGLLPNIEGEGRHGNA